MTLLIVINCTFIGIKKIFLFLAREFVYSNVCNFLVCSLAELSVFFYRGARFLIYEDIK